LIGIVVPLLLLIGRKSFGVSSTLRHICAASAPAKIAFLKYDWKKESWNLLFVVGIVLGAFLASNFIPNGPDVSISERTAAALTSLGITDHHGLVPTQLFNWHALTSWQGWVFIVLGGFLVGFGSRYAGGCTSGHAITGLSNLQWVSLVAVVGFFVGGLIVTHLLYPVIL
jgi:uncharacterized membrane protein YedE/YeeE